MKFITRLLSVSALGLAIGLASAGAASAHTTGGLPAFPCQTQCCGNWNPGPGQGNPQPWGGDQNQCCTLPGQGNDHNWGMDQGQCCQAPNPFSQNQFFNVIPSANCFQPLRCTFPGRHHNKHHNKHHKNHKNHHHWQNSGLC